MAVVEAALEVTTPLGVVGVHASDGGLRRVVLPGGSQHVRARTASTGGRHADEAAEQIGQYARGERETFDLVLDWTSVQATHRRVLEALCDVAPYGTTVTYGELGRRAGVDDPREVGMLMATNPLPLVVPCHRVVASDGLGGYGGGLDLKRRLLELEGALPARLDLGF